MSLPGSHVMELIGLSIIIDVISEVSMLVRKLSNKKNRTIYWFLSKINHNHDITHRDGEGPRDGLRDSRRAEAGVRVAARERLGVSDMCRAKRNQTRRVMLHFDICSKPSRMCAARLLGPLRRVRWTQSLGQ